MVEEAKAVQEVAKFGQKGIDASVKVGSFLAKYLGPGFSHLGSAFSDYAQAFRHKNLLKLIDSVEELHKQRRLDGKFIPLLPKFAIPIIQEASLEDDDTVRDMWAGLIANATDPGRQFKLRKLYIEILSSLDAIDVQILILLCQDGLNYKYGFLSQSKLCSSAIAIEINRDEQDVMLSLSNLFRHALILDAWEESFENLGRSYSGFRVNNPASNFRIAHLGRILVEGCSISAHDAKPE